MLEKLQRLYNTLETIETKGKSTITMADCLRYVENLKKVKKPRALNLREKLSNYDKKRRTFENR